MDAVLADLKVGIPQLIEHLSAYFNFKAGDILSTGTPGGTGAGRTAPRWLREGDLVEIEVKPIGVLSNPVRRQTP